MKYKVGDKVRVRKDLKVNEKYGGMKVYCDKSCATIARLQRNKKKKEVKQIQKAECSISDVAAEAKRHGMSYGYFVGLMWLKKTREPEVYRYRWM